MIKLRNLAVAFIFNEQDVLMMKTSDNKRLFPNMWAPVGGHVESDEINDPQKACIREIYEETGIAENDLNDLRLKYITLRRKDDEIRIQYIFFMETKVKTFMNTDEGELFWINKSNLLSLETSFANRSVIEHYFNEGYKDNEVMIGVVDVVNEAPKMNWSELKNFNKF